MAERAPRVRVEHIMGTAIGIHVRDAVAPGVLDEVFGYLRGVDERFSTFKPASEVSRLRRGELREDEASPELREVLALCDDLWRTSEGYFDARAHRSDGLLDPSGLVKGWAIEQAALLLDATGARRFAINAGGDIVTRNEAERGRPWRVGIRHPLQPDRVAAVLNLGDGAVATSGAYERGQHIIDPRRGRPPKGLLSVTVVGPSLTYADAYATAAFAMGPAGTAWVARHPGYGAYAITAEQRVVWTSEVDAILS